MYCIALRVTLLCLRSTWHKWISFRFISFETVLKIHPLCDATLPLIEAHSVQTERAHGDASPCHNHYANAHATPNEWRSNWRRLCSKTSNWKRTTPSNNTTRRVYYTHGRVLLGSRIHHYQCAVLILFFAVLYARDILLIPWICSCEHGLLDPMMMAAAVEATTAMAASGPVYFLTQVAWLLLRYSYARVSCPRLCNIVVILTALQWRAIVSP